MATLLLAPMPRIKPLDEAARLSVVGRRTLQRWLGEGRLTAYRIAGDKRRFVDVDEIEKLRRPEPLPRREKGEHGKGTTRTR
jgi:excisionase family DNA binding protein